MRRNENCSSAGHSPCAWPFRVIRLTRLEHCYGNTSLLMVDIMRKHVID